MGKLFVKITFCFAAILALSLGQVASLRGYSSDETISGFAPGSCMVADDCKSFCGSCRDYKCSANNCYCLCTKSASTSEVSEEAATGANPQENFGRQIAATSVESDDRYCHSDKECSYMRCPSVLCTKRCLAGECDCIC